MVPTTFPQWIQARSRYYSETARAEYSVRLTEDLLGSLLKVFANSGRIDCVKGVVGIDQSLYVTRTKVNVGEPLCQSPDLSLCPVHSDSLITPRVKGHGELSWAAASFEDSSGRSEFGECYSELAREMALERGAIIDLPIVPEGVPVVLVSALLELLTSAPVGPLLNDYWIASMGSGKRGHLLECSWVPEAEWAPGKVRFCVARGAPLYLLSEVAAKVHTARNIMKEEESRLVMVIRHGLRLCPAVPSPTLHQVR